MHQLTTSVGRALEMTRVLKRERWMCKVEAHPSGRSHLRLVVTDCYGEFLDNIFDEVDIIMGDANQAELIRLG